MIFRRGLNSGHCVKSKNNGRAKIHGRNRKPPTKDVTPNKQTAVLDLKTHMLRTIKDQKRKYHQSGNNKRYPKGVLGLPGKDADNQTDHGASPCGKTRTDIPFSRRWSAGN